MSAVLGMSTAPAFARPLDTGKPVPKTIKLTPNGTGQKPLRLVKMNSLHRQSGRLMPLRTQRVQPFKSRLQAPPRTRPAGSPAPRKGMN